MLTLALALDEFRFVTDSEHNNNVEQTETFEVFFPDGTVSALQGGQENIDKLKELMRAAST